MPSDNALVAARRWLKEMRFLPIEGYQDDGATVHGLVETLEEFFRAECRRAGFAWHRDGAGPDVPVLQERYDALLAEVRGYREAVERGDPSGTPPGLLAIAVAELRKSVERLLPEPETLEAENEALRRRLEDRERDLRDAAGDNPVEIPEPGTREARLLAANVLLRRQVADLVAGGGRGGRLEAAEAMLRDLREVATTADEERQSTILRKWGLRWGAYTTLGTVAALVTKAVRDDGSAVETAECEVCGGRGLIGILNAEMSTIDCSACDGTGLVPAGRP